MFWPLFFLNFIFLPQEIKPPGVLKVAGLYVDRTEVLNIHWIEYESFSKMELPNSDHWRVEPDSTNTWYKVPRKRYEPITLITYEQAVRYCEWRSEVVSERLGINVTYRLPSIEEWEFIASTLMTEDQKKINSSLRRLSKQIEKNNGQLPIRKDITDKIYDLFSSVSEMTATKGIAKGGNNANPRTLQDRTGDRSMSGPHPFLGFRCVAEIHE